MFKKLTLILIVSSLAFIQGCSTLADAKAGKGNGTVATYDATFDAIWSAIPALLKELELPVVNTNKSSGEVLAQNGISGFSWGDNVAIYVEKVDGQIKTRVEVISKRALATTVFATNWETKIIQKLDQKFKRTP